MQSKNKNIKKETQQKVVEDQYLINPTKEYLIEKIWKCKAEIEFLSKQITAIVEKEPNREQMMNKICKPNNQRAGLKAMLE